MHNYEYYTLFLLIDPSKSYKLEPSNTPAHSTSFFKFSLCYYIRFPVLWRIWHIFATPLRFQKAYRGKCNCTVYQTGNRPPLEPSYNIENELRKKDGGSVSTASLCILSLYCGYLPNHARNWSGAVRVWARERIHCGAHRPDSNCS